MKVGAEREAEYIRTFLSPFSHTFFNHLGLEVAHRWSIPPSTYTKTKRLSLLFLHVLQNKRPQKKGLSSSIPMLNQLELTIDVELVFCLISKTSSDPLRIRTKPSSDSLEHKQTTLRLALYGGNVLMIQGKCIPSKSPTHTMSRNVNCDY